VTSHLSAEPNRQYVDEHVSEIPESGSRRANFLNHAPPSSAPADPEGGSSHSGSEPQDGARAPGSSRAPGAAPVSGAVEGSPWNFAQSLAERVAPKRMIRDALKRFGYELRKTPASQPLPPVELPLVDLLELLLREHLRENSAPFFVQIGANDGRTEDPIHALVRRYGLRGLLVEPQPRAFQRLVQNYEEQPGLAFENCLLGGGDGRATFYTVREDAVGLPFWLHQSASLDRAIVANALRVFRDAKGVRAIPQDHESLIDPVSVPSLSWKTLLAKHSVTKIDLLVIDTMGFDYEILKLLPFDTIKPSIIHFEHSLLSAHDQRACLEFLAGQGYSLAKVAVDTIACLDVQTRRWLVQDW
jgi:FkbM family methyltransferase